jgi:hypothetical protein
MPSRRAALLFLSLNSMAMLVAGPAAAKPWKPIQLQRVAVGIADIVPGPGGRAVVGIPISSHSTDPVRVAVRLRPPEPAHECSAHMTLEAHRDTIIVCPQDGIVAAADYVISIAVFGDSSESDTLESGSTSAQFSKKEVKALGEWLEASTLPKTFKEVEKVDKVTAGTSLSSMFGVPHGGGTLTVDSTGVTYKTKKESIVIPATALRDVGINDADPKQPWVVVAFEDAGTKKSISFKPNVYRGDASAGKIEAAIRSAMWAPITRK